MSYWICAEVSHALRQFIFECMRLSAVDDSGVLPVTGFDRQLDIPWDDPYPYYTSMIPSEPPEDDPVHCVEENNPDDAVPQPSEMKAGELKNLSDIVFNLQT